MTGPPARQKRGLGQSLRISDGCIRIMV